jgi:hypothetical protein
MESSFIPPCAVLECLVMVFQLIGVVALCLNRLLPGTRWAERGRVWFVIALVGLGLSGAFCGRHDSQFALFAGLTMTGLLIGMIAGAGSIHLTARTARRGRSATALAG